MGKRNTSNDSACGGAAEDQAAAGSKKIQSPHDGIFQDFWNDREVAASFIEEYVPAKITRHLDFNSLKICKDTFIDRELDRYFSDVLYEIEFRKKPLLLYFLFEHKSVPEWLASFQLLKYKVKIWELYLKQNKKKKNEKQFLPVIISQVIYHGKKKWSLDTRFIALFEETADLENYIPDFSYDLYDISHLPDEEIKGAVLLKIILKTLKYAFDPRLREKLKDIFKLFEQLSDKTKATEYLEILLRYLGDSRDFTTEELRESLTEVYEEGGAILTTLSERLRQQGKQDKEWLVVRNSLSKGLPVELIADITGLPVNKVKQMKNKIEREKLAPIPPTSSGPVTGNAEYRV
jgi:predicted transposase/invertase (TIGR01784 family)